MYISLPTPSLRNRQTAASHAHYYLFILETVYRWWFLEIAKNHALSQIIWSNACSAQLKQFQCFPSCFFPYDLRAPDGKKTGTVDPRTSVENSKNRKRWGKSRMIRGVVAHLLGPAASSAPRSIGRRHCCSRGPGGREEAGGGGRGRRRPLATQPAARCRWAGGHGAF